MTETVAMSPVAVADQPAPPIPPQRLRGFAFHSPEGSFDLVDPQPLPGTRDGLATRVSETLMGLPAGHRVVGALPFEHDDAWLGWGPAATPPLHRAQLRRRPVLQRVQEEPSGPAYRRAVRAALDRIAHPDELEKVVLSRRIRLDFDGTLDAADVLATLRAQQPTAWTFAVTLAAPLRTSRWVGASPELLLRKRGRSVSSVPLAGSAARHPDRWTDEVVRQDLSVSPKDRREHALVVEAIADTLAPHCTRLRVPAAPTLMPAGAVWHLGTPIDGELRDPDLSSLELVDRLHPTPALGGWPRAQARQAIAEIEGSPRGVYGGAVGWCDASGDGTWVVAIRCARISDRTMWAQAGAGIVDGSDPAAELAETDTKLRTVLAAVGLRPEDLS